MGERVEAFVEMCALTLCQFETLLSFLRILTDVAASAFGARLCNLRRLGVELLAEVFKQLGATTRIRLAVLHHGLEQRQAMLDRARPHRPALARLAVIGVVLRLLSQQELRALQVVVGVVEKRGGWMAVTTGTT